MRHKAGLLFFIVLAAAAVIICSGGLGGQQKYISYSFLGGFSKMSQKSFSKVLFHPDLQQKPMIWPAGFICYSQLHSHEIKYGSKNKKEIPINSDADALMD